MNKFIVIALILAIASAKYQTRSNVDPKIELAEMQKDAFGSTFLSAVQMAIHTAVPTDEVSALLD